MEKKIIGHTIKYLIARDLCLLMLICGHISIYYNLISNTKTAIIPLVAAGVLLWIIFFAKLMYSVSKAKKDKYLVSAFSDEYFKAIKVQAGYNGFISMCTLCLVLILGNIVLNALSINVDIPIHLASEVIILFGVVTDDISKILLSRG